MNDLQKHAESYLSLRRSLGFKLHQHGRLLNDFIDYLDNKGASTITRQLALDWATKPANVHQVWWHKRLSVACSFSRYLHTIDPSAEVPTIDLLPYGYQRPKPYLFLETEIVRLIDTFGTLNPPFRALTYQTLFGLLASTGMRVNEAICLERSDFDPATGRILIRESKFGKSRQLPLHPTAVEALKKYARQRDRLAENLKISSFFVSIRGTRLIYGCVRRTFKQIIAHLDFHFCNGTRLPRIHDLRHTFAVTTLREWYRSGTDVAGKLPILSAYLGHVSPSSTYWYLQEEPELLSLAAKRIGQPKVGGRWS